MLYYKVMAAFSLYLQSLANINWANQGVIFLCFFSSILSFFLWSFLQLSSQKITSQKTAKIQNLFGRISNGSFALIAISSFAVFLLKMLYSSNVAIQHDVFGGFDKLFGIEHSIDFIKIFLSFLLSVILLYYFTITKFSLKSITDAEEVSDMIFSNALIFAICGSFFAIITTNDIFNLYVFIEVSSICLYSSTFLKNTKQSISAGFEYLIFGSLASCLIIFAIVVIYYLTGQLNIDKIMQQMTIIMLQNDKLNINNSSVMLVKSSFWLFTIACFIKLGTVPFFKWTINFYTKTSLIFTSFAASIVNKIYLYILFCVVFKIFFTINPQLHINFTDYVSLYLAIFIFTFSIFAYFETNALRLIAISSIINTCYVIIAVVFGGVFSKSLIMLVVGDMICKFLIFLILQYILQSSSKSVDTQNNVQFLQAISNSSSKVKTLFFVCFFIIASLPPFPTFFAKIDITLSLLQNGKNLIFWLLILSNALSIFYLFKIIMSVIFLNKTPQSSLQHKDSLSLFVLAWSLISAYVAFGFII